MGLIEWGLVISLAIVWAIEYNTSRNRMKKIIQYDELARSICELYLDVEDQNISLIEELKLLKLKLDNKQ